MRTVEEIQYWIGRRPDQGTFGYMHALDIAYDDGFDSGMHKGLRMTQEGKTPADILSFAQADQAAYVPHGDDQEDAWQSGYTVALEWCAEQFDWDETGQPIGRPGNVVGL